MKFISVYKEKKAADILYKLLSEREYNVSHKRMPTMKDHLDFMASRPYRKWYLIQDGENYVGAIYLGTNNEIGIGILKEFEGNLYGRMAVNKLITTYKPLKAIPSIRSGYFIANCHPENKKAIQMFQAIGFRHIQNTLELS